LFSYKSKKNQLEEAEVIENQLKVNISNLNKKEEELKVLIDVCSLIDNCLHLNV
jgi:hypothetical protein